MKLLKLILQSIVSVLIVIALVLTLSKQSKSETYATQASDVKFVQCTVVKEQIKTCTDITDGKMLDTDWTKWKE